jgi:hypothetical protein
MITPFARLSACVYVLALSSSGALAQEKPLTRTFEPGAKESYQANLRLEVEIRGVRPETVAGKTVLKPYILSAEMEASWIAARTTNTVDAVGAATLDESPNSISVTCPQQNVQLPEKALQDSLDEACTQLKNWHALHYVERSDGLIRDLPVQNLSLGEDPPALLTAWLRRNLRPSVIFPKESFHLGLVSQRPVHANNMNGSETIEWLEGSNDPPAAALHVVQDLSWNEPAAREGLNNAGGTPPGVTSFYADSKTTVSLLDGSVLSAVRTASRETKRTPGPVEGLSMSPEFASKLTVTVTFRKIS